MPEDLDGLIQVKNEEVVLIKENELERFKPNDEKSDTKDGFAHLEASFTPDFDYSSEKDYKKESSEKIRFEDQAKEGSTSSNGSGMWNDRPKISTMQSKPTAKKLSKFYQKQTNLLENFKNDNVIIEDSQRRRQKALSLSFDKDGEVLKLVARDLEPENIPHRRACTDLPEDREESSSKSPGMGKAARWLAMATLIVNSSLVVAKAAASYLSGSLSIISSLVDSAVDITSGIVIWLTARAIMKHDPYMYPRGRTRLEPIALIIVSVIMGVASIQMTAQSVESVLRNTVDPHVDFASLCIMFTTVVVKFILMLLCKRFDSDASINVLAQDHRNDCLSNLAALFCAWGASRYWIYLDPVGAILVSLYIAITWFITGKEHLTMLSGKSAEPEFINRIVRVCVQHSPRIDYIDTVYVYHYGTRYLVEVHVVMDPYMSLKDAHDISEALQNNIESLREVERAFVHCDYEFSHMPCHEHKIV